MARIYGTKQWQQVRQIYLSMQPLCEVCKKMGRVSEATQVDHVQSIEQGGAPFDLDNLKSLCQKHHSRKTVLRDRGFGNQPSKKPVIPGCGADGLPIDPDHPWNRGTTSS